MARTGKPKLTTTQRGLGAAHQAARKAAIAALQDGDACARCELRGIYHPMYRAAAARLDLDDFPGRIYGGPQVKRLSWRRCNRRAGAEITNRIRGARRPPPTPQPSAYTRW